MVLALGLLNLCFACACFVTVMVIVMVGDVSIFKRNPTVMLILSELYFISSEGGLYWLRKSRVARKTLPGWLRYFRSQSSCVIPFHPQPVRRGIKVGERPSSDMLVRQSSSTKQ